MKVALLGPVDFSVESNPGWHMITAGIRWLVRRVAPDALFLPVPISGDEVGWGAARTCDVAIFCGNPRFTLSPGMAFWENAIWDNLLELQQCGVPVIDGWAGSAFPVSAYDPTPEEMATAITFFPGRQARLRDAATLRGRITRDQTMQLIYERAGAPATLLPCSSWWAKDEYGITRGEPAYDLLVIYRMQDREADMRSVADKRMSERPLRVIATTWADYMWWTMAGGECELVCDPASLLRLYARAGNVISYRLHAAIPAASLGCNVIAVSIDSRTDTCHLFDIPVVSFTSVDTVETHTLFRPARVPDELAVLTTLKELLC